MSNHSDDGDGDGGVDAYADSIPLRTTMSMVSSVASSIGIRSVTSDARIRQEIDDAAHDDEEENHRHRGTTYSPTPNSIASIDSEDTEESSIGSAGTSLSQIPNSAIPAKESQSIGGPKYYIATHTKRGQARVVHKAMPSIHEETSSQGGIGSFIVGGNDASSSVAEEMGYEIMEYELVREAAEREEEEAPQFSLSAFTRNMIGSLASAGDDTEADSYCTTYSDDDGTRSMTSRTETAMSGSVGTIMLGSVSEYDTEADCYYTDDDETRSLTSRTETAMASSVATIMLGSVAEYDLEADSYYMDDDGTRPRPSRTEASMTSSVATSMLGSVADYDVDPGSYCTDDDDSRSWPLRAEASMASSVATGMLGSVAGDNTEGDSYYMGDDGTRSWPLRAEASMGSSVAYVMLGPVAGDNTEADGCYTIHSDTIRLDNDGAGSAPSRTVASMANSVANSVASSIASFVKGNKKKDAHQTKKNHRGGTDSPTNSTTSIDYEDAYSCIMVASIGGSVDSIGTPDSSTIPAKGPQLAGGMPAIHGDETSMNCEC